MGGAVGSGLGKSVFMDKFAGGKCRGRNFYYRPRIQHGSSSDDEEKSDEDSDDFSPTSSTVAPLMSITAARMSEVGGPQSSSVGGPVVVLAVNGAVIDPNERRRSIFRTSKAQSFCVPNYGKGRGRQGSVLVRNSGGSGGVRSDQLTKKSKDDADIDSQNDENMLSRKEDESVEDFIRRALGGLGNKTAVLGTSAAGAGKTAPASGVIGTTGGALGPAIGAGSIETGRPVSPATAVAQLLQQHSTDSPASALKTETREEILELLKRPGLLPELLSSSVNSGYSIVETGAAPNSSSAEKVLDATMEQLQTKILGEVLQLELQKGVHQESGSSALLEVGSTPGITAPPVTPRTGGGPGAGTAPSPHLANRGFLGDIPPPSAPLPGGRYRHSIAVGATSRTPRGSYSTAGPSIGAPAPVQLPTLLKDGSPGFSAGSAVGASIGYQAGPIIGGAASANGGTGAILSGASCGAGPMMFQEQEQSSGVGDPFSVMHVRSAPPLGVSPMQITPFVSVHVQTPVVKSSDFLGIDLSQPGTNPIESLPASVERALLVPAGGSCFVPPPSRAEPADEDDEEEVFAHDLFAPGMCADRARSQEESFVPTNEQHSSPVEWIQKLEESRSRLESQMQTFAQMLRQKSAIDSSSSSHREADAQREPSLTAVEGAAPAPTNNISPTNNILAPTTNAPTLVYDPSNVGEVIESPFGEPGRGPALFSISGDRLLRSNQQSSSASEAGEHDRLYEDSASSTGSPSLYVHRSKYDGQLKMKPAPNETQQELRSSFGTKFVRPQTVVHPPTSRIPATAGAPGVTPTPMLLLPRGSSSPARPSAGADEEDSTKFDTDYARLSIFPTFEKVSESIKATVQDKVFQLTVDKCADDRTGDLGANFQKTRCRLFSANVNDICNTNVILKPALLVRKMRRHGYFEAALRKILPSYHQRLARGDRYPRIGILDWSRRGGGGGALVVPKDIDVVWRAV